MDIFKYLTCYLHCSYRSSYILLSITLLYLSACSEEIQLTKQEAFSPTLQMIQEYNQSARQAFDKKKYQKAIKLWYKVINTTDQFNTKYPPENKIAVSFLNDKADAMCNIGHAYTKLAGDSSNNINIDKDALQSYLLCIQYRPDNIKAYDAATDVAIRLNDSARFTKLEEWKKATIEIHGEYQLRARQIDARYSSRGPENTARNSEFVNLYQWAYDKANERGVSPLAEFYGAALETYKKYTAGK